MICDSALLGRLFSCAFSALSSQTIKQFVSLRAGAISFCSRLSCQGQLVRGSYLLPTRRHDRCSRQRPEPTKATAQYEADANSKNGFGTLKLELRTMSI